MLTGQLQTTSKPETILLIFVSFKNTKCKESILENLIVKRMTARYEKLHNLHLTPVTPSLRKIPNI